jgi:REP element-mobilizing transposase RayT
MRLERATGNARRRELYKAIRTATTRVDTCIRIVHLSIQRSHLHAIVEADDRDALSKGMQGFAISAARHINRASGRKRGRVFADRYHAQYLRSPAQTRNAISYVLNNWRHHGDDAVSPTFRIDPYSSAILFDGFADYAAPPRVMWAIPYEPLRVRPPGSWLLRVGWKRAGDISCREVPAS